MANEKQVKKEATTNEKVAPKENAAPKAEAPKQHPYDVSCINLKLSIRQVNELRSSCLCKIAALQSQLECCFNPQEMQAIKGLMNLLTEMAKSLDGILKEALATLKKPTIQSSIDKIDENKAN